MSDKPGQRTTTIRQAILRYLREGPCSVRDLSSLVGIQEKDVQLHLDHIKRSLRRGPECFTVEPASCLECGYVFVKRRRLSKPSACPVCRQRRIEPPLFQVRSVM